MTRDLAFDLADTKVFFCPWFPSSTFVPSKISKRFIPILSTVLLISVVGGTEASKDPYYALIYDFEVAIFCGLADRSLYDNYLAHRDRIEGEDHRDESELTSVRIKAMAAADREYDNRGLGGHRNWCATDGQNGVQRIRNYPN